MQKLLEGFVGCAVTISLSLSLLVGRQVAGLHGMATGFVASVGIIGALWIAATPERSTKAQRVIGLFMAVLCAVGISYGGWRLGWLYGLGGWLVGLGLGFVLTRVTSFS